MTTTFLQDFGSFYNSLYMDLSKPINHFLTYTKLTFLEVSYPLI